MSSIDIPIHTCVKCGYKMEATSETHGDSTPREGDITICLGCGHLGAFNADLTIRELTQEESLEVSLDPRIMEAQLVRDHVVGDKIKCRLASE